MLASWSQGIRGERFRNLTPCGGSRDSRDGVVSRERPEGLVAAGVCRRRGIALKQHFKIKTKAPVVIPEENSVLRIGDVGVNCERIEVIRQIVACYR